jgi:dTDP-glucose 4,6-dehydratase
MAKFIVTGGLGFIGSNLVEYLLNLGHFVINIDKVSYSSNFFNTDSFKNNKNYKFFKADICNKQKISQIIKNNKPVCIFNLAAETHVDRSIDSSDNFIKTNVLGVHSLLEILIKNKKIKLIHISTDEVYGDIQSNLRANEKTPYNPGNPYSATKAASDHLINSYNNTYKINAIITNCCNNYGPKQNPEKFIPKIIFNILNKKKLPLYGKGQNTREWIYVLDHCKALYKIYQKGKIGETYNIGSNQNFKNIDLIKKIITLAKKRRYYNKKSKITYVKDRPGHDLRYALNSKKIRKYIKWKPQVMIDKGLTRTLEWYKTNKKFFKFIKNKNFIYRLGKNR